MQEAAIYHHYRAHTIVASPPFPYFFPKILSLTTNPQQRLLAPFATRRTNAATKAELVSKTAIQRIAEKLRNLGFVNPAGSGEEDGDSQPGPGSPGEIFLPSPKSLPIPRVGQSLDSSWSTPDHPVPEPGAGAAFDKVRSSRGVRERKPPAPLLAELRIPEAELKLLRTAGIRLDKRLKVGKPGITEGIVNGIHERWRRSEVVKIKCEDLCRVNMKRTQEILERKTGGLVIWRSGSTIILYRGTNYVYPYFLRDTIPTSELIEDTVTVKSDTNIAREITERDNALPEVGGQEEVRNTPPFRLAGSSLVMGVGSPNKVRFQLPGELEMVEASDRLLDGLGPRFSDWWGYDPLPVDGDLLPAVVTGYRRPFRLLPYGVKPKLTDREMTILRRLSRPLPCHFALGRNRNLQGLAAAMVKLWEKCEIAKVAVKRGVQNTNSELMAEELKLLTGGTLLSRDREFIVFYRGKDFLPPAVSNAIEDRKKHVIFKEHQAETRKANSHVYSAADSEIKHFDPVTSTEAPEIKRQAESELGDEKRRLDVASSAGRRLDAKLSLALEKKEAAEKELAELGRKIDSAEPVLDREAITEEERYMLRKLGLRMKAFCLLGRRGVFDGTIENMHLHWKYRELVKIISKDRCVEEVRRTARLLEAESGGILVAVERVNKGYAIIVYRGKNYYRPDNLRPRTLLNKRQAMKRSLEEQRYKSLKLHVLRLGKNIEKIKDQMASNRYGAFSSSFETDEHKPSLSEGGSSLPVESEAAVATDKVKDDDMSRITASGSEEDFFGTAGDGDASASENEDENPFEPDDTRLLETLPLDNRRRSDSLIGEEISDPVLGATSMFTHPQEHVLHAENTFRAAPLSNRERLVLRRQALLMKKRPVLAIGRNNVITGVAKAILTHFKKKPLAIVNVKGRAKGTSIRELVFKLEQATGAVLVSQEPNKVILYRGWGADEEKPGSRNINSRAAKKAMGNGAAVSPEVMAAIRFECGLEDAQGTEGTFE